MDDMKKLKDLAVSESGFVFDPYTGATFSANATGHAILEGLRSGASREKILGILEERFDVAGEDLERDLDEFLRTLRREGIVDEEPLPSGADGGSR